MGDWNYLVGESSSFGGKSGRGEDFEEEDVWGAVKQREDSSPKMRNYKVESSSSASAWGLSSAPRMMIPKANTPTNHESKLVQQSSAPMNIPDWSKIYGKHARKKGKLRDSSWAVDGGHISNVAPSATYDHEDYNYYGKRGGDCFEYDVDDEDEDGDMVPPHEWLAKKLARSQISSFSVCEGIGRTLKGRDLSKVRNAILTKTGFIE